MSFCYGPSSVNDKVTYKLSLDDLDLSLLPIDRSLSKYGRDGAIWSMGSEQDREYSLLIPDCDQYYEIEVLAERKDYYDVDLDSIPQDFFDSSLSDDNNSIHCTICNKNIQKCFIQKHIESDGHSRLLKLLALASSRLKHYKAMLNKCSQVQQSSSDYCEVCNCEVESLETHGNTYGHHKSMKKDMLVKELINIYESGGLDDELKMESCIDDGKNDFVEELVKDKYQINIEDNKEDVNGTDKDNIVSEDAYRGPFCAVCKVYPGFGNLNHHLLGKKHAKKIKLINEAATNVDTQAKNENKKNNEIVLTLSHRYYYCAFCKVHFAEDDTKLHKHDTTINANTLEETHNIKTVEDLSQSTKGLLPNSFVAESVDKTVTDETVATKAEVNQAVCDTKLVVLQNWYNWYSLLWEI